jgi:fumarate reductase subunit D
MARRPMEPFLWLLFSAGGVLSALLIPALLILFGLAFPLGWVTPDHTHLSAVLGHPVTRVVLFGFCVLALFHWAHRFRYALYDGLQLKHLERAINLFCYGGALAGAAASGYLLLTAW